MTREADYTIKGFLYQFNVTLEQLLLSPDGSTTTVEGIIEDIDINTSSGINAIQCKYHESTKKFTLSEVTKPILQMLANYSDSNCSDVKYTLYAHFPNENPGDKILTKNDIENIIKTSNKKYIANYISKIKPTNNSSINELISKKRKSADDLLKITEHYTSDSAPSLNISIDNFLKNFNFVIGKPINELISDTENLLSNHTSLTNSDISELFYPNAIQIIANKSIQHNPLDRVIDKESLIDELEKTKKTAISRWTKELKSYDQLLKKRRDNLKTNLHQNHRLRYFILEDAEVEDFDNHIVNFIIDYLNKYHHKIKLHSHTPAFCIKTDDDKLLPSIESRLFTKKVRVETGYKGGKFFHEAFMREPQRIVKDSWFEFHLRLCRLSNESINTLNNRKCHDLFVVGKSIDLNLDLQDLNVEHLDIPNFKELKYLLHLV